MARITSDLMPQPSNRLGLPAVTNLIVGGPGASLCAVPLTNSLIVGPQVRAARRRRAGGRGRAGLADRQRRGPHAPRKTCRPPAHPPNGTTAFTSGSGRPTPPNYGPQPTEWPFSPRKYGPPPPTRMVLFTSDSAASQTWSTAAHHRMALFTSNSQTWPATAQHGRAHPPP